MQKSRGPRLLLVPIRAQLIAVTFLFIVVYDTSSGMVLAADRQILQGVMHDISKSGPVHAKFKSLVLKELRKSLFGKKSTRNALQNRAFVQFNHCPPG
jgi:hypothetical protein